MQFFHSQNKGECIDFWLEGPKFGHGKYERFRIRLRFYQHSAIACFAQNCLATNDWKQISFVYPV